MRRAAFGQKELEARSSRKGYSHKGLAIAMENERQRMFGICGAHFRLGGLLATFIVFWLGSVPELLCFQQPKIKEAELVLIGRDGLTPKKITRPAGAFLMIVKSQTPVPHLSVHLVSTGGNHVVDADMEAAFGNYETVLNLQPGTYQLTEANHPSWGLTLVITN